MKDANGISATLVRASKEMDKWDLLDQLTYVTKITELAEMADEIMARYDGRNERFAELLDALKGGEDEETA